MFRMDGANTVDVNSGNFIFRGLGATNSPNSWISQCTVQILKSKHVFPNLKILTFNTKTFYERKAKISEDQIEFYMAFRPKTLVATARIDKFIFHVPEEFKYPSIRRL